MEPVARCARAAGRGARLEGTAEAIPLDDSSVDAVTVAQAFHWFDGDGPRRDPPRAAAGGSLPLVWNRRIEDAPVHVAMETILAPYRADVPTHRGDAWRGAFESTSLFEPLEEHVFPNEQTLDADGMADRIGSISFIASLPDDERAAALRSARELAPTGPVTLPYRTEVLFAAARAA